MINTELWDELLEVPSEYRLLYWYLYTNCNHAGLIKVQTALIKVYCGQVDIAAALLELERIGLLRMLENGKTFLPEFVKANYRNLGSNKSNAARSCLRMLSANGVSLEGLEDKKEGLPKGCPRVAQPQTAAPAVAAWDDVPIAPWYPPLVVYPLPEGLNTIGSVQAWRNWLQTRQEKHGDEMLVMQQEAMLVDFARCGVMHKLEGLELIDFFVFALTKATQGGWRTILHDNTYAKWRGEAQAPAASGGKGVSSRAAAKQRMLG